jgi:CDP-6-deoxy-D-xylo-4-hexulose-3-dehydrase
MFDNKNELEARQEILGIVDEYCKKYHNQKQYKEGDRISYASRVYDSKVYSIPSYKVLSDKDNFVRVC